MWYFQNLKQSFLEFIHFRKHAQMFISSGLEPWICYLISFFVGLVGFFACIGGYDLYFNSPKKRALLEQEFGKFGE